MINTTVSKIFSKEQLLEFLNVFIKGIFIGILYLQVTRANDTTIENVVLFALSYFAMVYGAKIANIDSTIVTTAFITKTVFTLVDDRIRKVNDLL